MIGKIYTILTPYYDIRLNKNSFKKRPALIIGGPRNNDYTILPISRVTNKKNLDMEYDIEVKMGAYPDLNLNADSYIRVHKQTTVHESLIYQEVSNLRQDYLDLYLEVISKLEEYNSLILENAF